MTCYKPNYIYIFRDINGNCKTIFKNGYDFNFILPKNLPPLDIKDSNGLIHRYYFEKASPIPCGSCVGCQMDYANQWKNRLMAEFKESKNAYFITLTYNDLNLPKNCQLDKKQCQVFLKRLKDYFLKNFDYKEIKYYLVGEYGSNTYRPHYHAIFFNLPLTLNELFCYTQKTSDCIPKNDRYKFKLLDKGESNGEKIFSSPLISKLWPYGNNIIGSTTIKSCGYVARYCNKKLGRDSDFKKKLKDYQFNTEFLLCSKNLGKKYIFSNNLVDNKYWSNGKIISGGRYGLKNFDETTAQKIKDKNLLAFSDFKSTIYGDLNEYFKVECEKKEGCVKALKRLKN